MLQMHADVDPVRDHVEFLRRPRAQSPRRTERSRIQRRLRCLSHGLLVGDSTESNGVGAFPDALGWSQTFLTLAVLFAASLVLVTTNRLFRLGY